MGATSCQNVTAPVVAVVGGDPLSPQPATPTANNEQANSNGDLIKTALLSFPCPRLRSNLGNDNRVTVFIRARLSSRNPRPDFFAQLHKHRRGAKASPRGSIFPSVVRAAAI
jgi:hypothetical protein